MNEGAVHIVIDSSGLKIYGQGERSAAVESTPARRRQTPYLTRRARGKIHLAVDEKTGQILAQRLRVKQSDDAWQLPDLVSEVRQTGLEVKKVGADGAYHTYQNLIKAHIEPIIPPRENAAWWVDKTDLVIDHPRNRALEQIDQGG